MVMELMTGGELFDRIVERGKYSEAQAVGVVRKITDALAYCHARGVVHRDLKPENLLYTDATDAAEIKVADFGLAKMIQESGFMSTACGTPGYVAPEVLESKPYTEKVDCWSVGVILYILLCGFPPFYDENNAKLFAQIKAAAYDFPSPYWDGVSKQAKDLISKLLVVEPTQRLSATQILAHPWLTGVASTHELNVSENLRRLQARKKFRQGVVKIQALQKFAMLGRLHHAAATGAAEADADAEADTHEN
jgi:calcium/calmodulin-dependent protein kinase I